MGKMLRDDQAQALIDLAERLGSDEEVARCLNSGDLDIDTVKFRVQGTEDMVEVQLWHSPNGWNLYWPDEDEEGL